MWIQHDGVKININDFSKIRKGIYNAWPHLPNLGGRELFRTPEDDIRLSHAIFFEGYKVDDVTFTFDNLEERDKYWDKFINNFA